jgi:hypothetical protein
MSAVYRIICSKLLVLIRLAIVVSLAGYSLSNATAAMHGPSSVEAQLAASMPEGHHGSEMAAHDHHGDVSADVDSVKLAKQECCNDFCVSLAIIATSDTLAGPVVSSIHEFIDDRRSFGEVPALHRPPNI